MATNKQSPTSTTQVVPLDYNIWQVTLTLAVPDYGSGGMFTALDAVTNSLDPEVTVLGSDEVLVHLVLCEANDSPVLAKRATTTLEADAELTSDLTTMLDTKASKPAKRNRKQRGDIASRVATVDAALRAMETASANELATLTGLKVKLVYNALYELHRAKKIGADKKHGKVTWIANKANK